MSGDHRSCTPFSNSFAGLPMLQVYDRKLKKMRPAKGSTKEEFTDFMKETTAKVNSLLEGGSSREKWLGAFGRWVKPRFSFDNPRIHGGKKKGGDIMRACGLSTEQRFPLPRYSPDIHRVIEHTHANVCYAFQEWLDMHEDDFNLPAYKLKLEELFYARMVDRVIDSDAITLPKLFAKIIEFEGGWPPKPWR